MKLTIIIVLTVCAAVISGGVTTASAQFPIKMPKIGKPKAPELPKADPPQGDQPGAGDNRNGGPQTGAKASNSKRVYQHVKPPMKPMFITSSIYVQAEKHDEYWKTPNAKDVSSWVPKSEFSIYVNRDTNGLDYLAEYFNPDGSPWFSESLNVGDYGADKTIRISSNRDVTRDMLTKKSTNAVGTYGVKITDKTRGETVFQGKFKVDKFLTDGAAKTDFDFFVDHDWMLPIGYVGFHHSALSDDSGGFDIFPSIWMKGDLNAADLEARVFFAGKQIASTKDVRSGVTTSSAGERTSQQGHFKPDQYFWKQWNFKFENLRVANGGGFNRDDLPNATYVDEKPGEYTVKILHNGVEVRELKFTVSPDGKLNDGGYSKTVMLPNYQIVVPVKVAAGVKWNALAYKTDAFYGNPVPGLVAQ